MLHFLIGVIFTLICIVAVASMNASIPIFAKINSNLATFQAIGSLAIAASAIVAFFLYKLNTNRHLREDEYKESYTFLKESIAILERAYEIFTDNGENKAPPRNDRLLWLTSARMLVRFRKIKKKICEPEHREINEEHEEYWRFQFYKILDENKTNFTKSYFNPSGAKYAGDCVARNSMAVIFDFAKWKEGGTDPLDEINDKELFAKGVIPIDQFGAEEFLEEYEEYWEEVQQLKAENQNDP